MQKLNRLTHELAHHGLPRDVRKWDTAATYVASLLDAVRT